MTLGGRVMVILALLMPLTVAAGCGGGAATAKPDDITLYTCVSDSTIQPVIAAFQKAEPGRQVNLYRAPTGDLNARVAGDVRSGGLKADVIWGCDPLTMRNYVSQGLVGGWTPETDIPATVRTADYIGVANLYLVEVNKKGTTKPTSWSELTGPAFRGGVAIPDPGTAASALGALGYFTENTAYGLKYYRDLKAGGAVQVSTPDNVTTGVAEGVYRAGMTTANSAYAAQKSGSPIEVVWPKPGAVAIFGPIALAKHASASAAAKDLISYVTSRDGQTLIGASGSYPTLPNVPGPTKPASAPVVYPDWSAISARQDTLLKSYRQIFGG
jgi:iron(III) transport system substrate-binding protein